MLLKKEWAKIPVRMCYVNNELGKNEKNGYYAAGVCPFLLIRDPDTGKSELSMLLVRELRQGLVKLNFLGGKRERGELPNETAYREFFEETGGLFSGQGGTLRSLLKDKNNQRLWLSDGRYILISVSSPQDWLHLPSRFEKWKEMNGHGSNSVGSEVKMEDEVQSDVSDLTSRQLKTKGLVWVSVRELTETSMKVKLSKFLKQIFKFPVFEEFVNAVPINLDYYEIAKYFEAQKWISSPAGKRSRVRSFHCTNRYGRRLNYDRWEYHPQHQNRQLSHFNRGGSFNSWNSGRLHQRSDKPDFIYYDRDSGYCG